MIELCNSGDLVDGGEAVAFDVKAFEAMGLPLTVAGLPA